MTGGVGEFAHNRGDIMRELHDLKEQVRQLAAARSLEAATIGEGGLRVKGGTVIVEDNGDVVIKGGGNVIIEDGGTVEVRDGGGQRLVTADGVVTFEVKLDPFNPTPSGDPQPSVFMRRDDGTEALTLHDGAPTEDGYRQILRLWDSSHNEIFAEDVNSGEGIATPWIPPGGMVPARFTDWPSSTSGSYETVWSGFLVKANPWIHADIRHTSDASDTAGDVRFLINGAVVGGTTDIGFAISQHVVTEPFPDEIGQSHFAEIQVRRTAGTGNVMCAPYQVTGRQSP